MRVLVLLVLAAAALADDIDPVRIPPVLDLGNGKDPVSGAKVARGKQIDFRGVRIHFASEENGKKFAAEPAKFVGKLHVKLTKQGIDLENKTCPVTGKDVDGKTVVVFHGLSTHLSGPEAAAKLAKDPVKAYARLGYTWVPAVIDLRNTSCPVTGDACYAEAPIWAEHDGIRVRFCCDDCIAEFKADPGRCFKALMVDPKKLKEKLGG